MPPENVTALLDAYRQGDREALARVIPLVYNELRVIASRYLKNERREHTLVPTALVHEAYLRMVDQSQPGWQNRAHFLGCAAQVMRHVLVDHARARARGKRGGGAVRVTLDESAERAGERDVDLVALDEALQALSVMSERQSRVVELRYFGGLSLDETAEVLQVSRGTVKRDWALARSWLRR